MLTYHNIKNSDEERKTKKTTEEQENKNWTNTFYKNIQQIDENFKNVKVADKTKISMEKRSDEESDTNGKKNKIIG